MCSPTAFAMTATGLNVFSEYMISQARAAAYGMQASVHDMNAKMAGIQSADVARQGADRERAVKAANATFAESQRASYGANSMDLKFGTPAAEMKQTLHIGAIDAFVERRNTINAQMDASLRVRSHSMNAELSRAASRNSRIAGALGMGTAAFKGVGHLSGWDRLPRWRWGTGEGGASRASFDNGTRPR